jgi:restriction endonuclease S subunit
MKNGWQTKTLGEVCVIDKCQGNYKHLPYVGLEHIESHTGRFIGSTEPFAVKSSTFKFSPDHLLYGRLRPYLNKVMAPAFEGHCSTEIFPLRPKAGLAREFLHYWFLRDETVAKIDATCTGARMPRANVNAALGFDFLLPPLSEQRRIVGILDEAFDGIAIAKANAEENHSNARALFDSIIDAIITGKLTHHWRCSHPNTQTASEVLKQRFVERRKELKETGTYKEPQPPVTNSPIDVPTGWTLASPEQLATHIVDCPHSTPKWTTSGEICLPRLRVFAPSSLSLNIWQVEQVAKGR